MTINKIQVKFQKGGYASIWTEFIAPDRSEKGKKNIVSAQGFKFYSMDFIEIYMVLDHQQNTG